MKNVLIHIKTAIPNPVLNKLKSLFIHKGVSFKQLNANLISPLQPLRSTAPPHNLISFHLGDVIFFHFCC